MTDVSSPAAARPPPGHRRLFLLLPLALLALYAAAGFLLVPWVAQRELPRVLDQHLQLNGGVREISFNPFTLRARVVGFTAAERDGAPVMAIDTVHLRLSWRSLIELAPVIEELRLVAPQAHLRISEQGRLNLADIAARVRAEPATVPAADADALPRFSLGHATIETGRVEFVDASAGVRETIHPMNLELSTLTTLVQRDGAFRFSARTAGGAALSWVGALSGRPVVLEGRMDIANLALEAFSPYAERAAGIRISGAFESLRIPLRAGLEAGALAVRIDQASMRLASLSVQPQGDQPQAQIGRVSLDGVSIDSASGKSMVAALRTDRVAVSTRASVPLASIGEIALDGLSFDLDTRDVALTAGTLKRVELSSGGDRPPIANVVSIGTTGLRVALKTRDVGIDTVQIEKPAIALERDAKGRIALGAWPAGEPATSDQPGWSLAVGAIDLLDGAGSYRDATSKRPLAVRFDGLAARLAIGLKPASGGPLLTATVERSSIGNLSAGRADSDQSTVSAGGVVLSRAVFDQAAGTLALGALDIGTLAMRVDTEGDRLDLLDLMPSSDAPSAPLAVSVESVEVAQMQVSHSDRKSGRSASLGGGRLALNNAKAKGETIEMAGAQFTARALELVDGGAGRTVRIGGAAFKAGTLSASADRFTANRVDIASREISVDDRDSGLALGVVAPKLAITGLSSAPGRSSGFNAELRFKAGGRISLRGEARVDRRTLTAKLEGTGIELSQFEPALKRVVNARLASGRASVAGRITAGGPAVLKFDGGASIAAFSLRDADGAPVIGWELLDVPALSVSPRRVKIGQLRLKKPSARVAISADRSFNIGRMFPNQAAAPKAASVTGKASRPLELEIGRIAVDNGSLAFADDSLSPGFNATIEKFGGTISGVSSDPGTRGRFSLKGEVNEGGQLDASGTLSPFALRDGTKVRLQFRGLDLTRITPYAVKFAGYRIARGVVSLDLNYDIVAGTISGDNRIVFNDLMLGEKVDSPDALDLPLELALALLQDPDGRIDVGLQVTGSLDDPQFDYGEIIAKAIGNLMSGIVAAPFRALAGILGGAAEDVGVVRFDAGSAALLPFERDKLAKVATALAQRPELKVRIPARFDARADAQAQRRLALRRAVARRAGIAVDAGADPGPLTVDDRPTRQALQALFIERFGTGEFERLTAEARQAMRDDAAGVEQARQRRVFEAVIEKLRDSQPLPDGALEAIAVRRAEAIDGALRAAGVDASRIERGSAPPLNDADAAQVSIELALTVR